MSAASVTFESECDYLENNSIDNNFHRLESSGSNFNSSLSSHDNSSQKPLSKNLSLFSIKNCSRYTVLLHHAIHSLPLFSIFFILFSTIEAYLLCLFITTGKQNIDGTASNRSNSNAQSHIQPQKESKKGKNKTVSIM
jgi:hypothetical protein